MIRRNSSHDYYSVYKRILFRASLLMPLLIFISCGPPKEKPDLCIDQAVTGITVTPVILDDDDNYIVNSNSTINVDFWYDTKKGINKTYWDLSVEGEILRTNGNSPIAFPGIFTVSSSPADEGTHTFTYSGSLQVLQGKAGLCELKPSSVGYNDEQDRIDNPDRGSPSLLYTGKKLNLQSGELSNVFEITAYGGTERYGSPGDKLQYPLAFPLVARVTDISGNPVIGAMVTFEITNGTSYAHFKNNTDCKKVENVPTTNRTTGLPGEDTIGGTAICPITLDYWGDITVEAKVTNSISMPTTTFNITCTMDETDGFYYGYSDNNDFYEPAGNEHYKGDGLWGTTMDLNTSTKNLRLEIDYMDGLGPAGNTFNLSADDWDLIYSELATIFAKVGIQLDDEYTYVNGEIPSFNTGSVICKMDAQAGWSNSDEKAIIGTATQTADPGPSTYTDDGIKRILASSRGMAGQGNLSRGDRLRVHVVLLPGGLPQPNSDDASKWTLGELLSRNADAVYLSSSEDKSFPWTSGNSFETSSELPIDSFGIVIFTSSLLAPDKISTYWKCTQNYTCIWDYVLARTIAHEIGHAIGLLDEDEDFYNTYKNQLMYKYVLYTISDYENLEVSYDDSYRFSLPASGDNKDLGGFINLRNVVGRETTGW